MNILPKKRWHVRTKENVARVRRDEAKAAEEEKRKLERALLAENERRLDVLRKKADDRDESLFGVRSREEPLGHDETPVTSSHVNFFVDLEREERKNLGTGNKDYEKEKAEEKNEWESKMGILKHLGEGSNELDKKKEWYEELPLRIREAKTVEKRVRPVGVLELKREEEPSSKKRKKNRDEDGDTSESESSHKHKKKRKKEKKKSKKHKRDKEKERLEEEERRRKKIEELREQRVARERAEAARTNVLLHPEVVKEEKKPRYNSQFNPHLSR